MNAQQQPRQAGRVQALAASDNRRAAGSSVGARIGQEISVTLKAQSVRGRNDSLAGYRQMMEVILKSQWITHNQNGMPNLDRILLLSQVLRRERLIPAWNPPRAYAPRWAP